MTVNRRRGAHPDGPVVGGVGAEGGGYSTQHARGCPSSAVTRCGADRLPSRIVVRGDVNAAGTDSLDLEPLYVTVDPDELNGMVEASTDRTATPAVSFTYEGCAVTETGETVHVRPQRDELTVPALPGRGVVVGASWPARSWTGP